MGRLTPSFRTVYSDVLDDLRKEMRNYFVDVSHKDAFDLLFTEACVRKSEQWETPRLPIVLDKLCMVDNINTRKLIEIKKAEIKTKETKIQTLSELIESLKRR